MRKTLAFIALLAPIIASAQQPNGTINSPIYATGYISQVGGVNITTKIPPQPNHPTNLNIYAIAAITGTWSIQLPNPAFEGQIIGINCGGAVNTFNITSSDGSFIDPNIPTACGAGGGFATQFDQRSNVWRLLGSANTPFNIQPFTPVASQWLRGLSNTGTFIASQPAFSDISGNVTASQMPAFIGGDCVSSIGTVNLTCYYTPSYTGAATGTLKAFLNNELVATSFTGVDQTGVSDSTTGLQAAIAAMTTTGKTLFIPCGNYKISGSGSQVFLVTNLPINIRGESKDCVSFKTVGVGATTDIIRQSITSIVYGTSITGISVDGAGGRYPYRLDANITGFLYGARIAYNNLYTPANSSIYLNGVDGGNGAIGHSIIDENNLSGITCIYCGDNFGVRRNIQSGAVIGFEGSFVSGAANFIYEENTVSNSVGCIVLHSGAHPKIINNEFEIGVPGSAPNNACIDLWGDTQRIYGANVEGNTVSILQAAGSPGQDVLRIDSVDTAYIDGNRLAFYFFDGAFHIKMTANAAPKLPIIGGGNKYEITATGSSTPYFFNGSGYNAGCAPPMDGVTSKFLRQGTGGTICGSFSNLITSDLPTLFATNFTNSASTTAPVVASGFCTSPGVSASNGTIAFAVFVGTACAANNGILTLPAAATRWKCDADSTTAYASNVLVAVPTSTTTVQIYNYSRTTGAATNFTSSDILNMSCKAY